MNIHSNKIWVGDTPALGRFWSIAKPPFAMGAHPYYHIPELQGVLINAEALLCDVRAGEAGNKMAEEIRAILAIIDQKEERE